MVLGLLVYLMLQRIAEFVVNPTITLLEIAVHTAYFATVVTILTMWMSI